MPRKPSHLRIGNADIPAPGTWPAATRHWFEAAVGEHGNSDLYIFEPEAGCAFLILEDAIAALGILDRAECSVSTADGYPIVTFDRAAVEARARELAEAGYRVHVLVPDYGDGKRAEVVDIAGARVRGKAARA